MKLSLKTLLVAMALPLTLASACSAAQNSAKPTLQVTSPSSKTVKTAKHIQRVKTSSHGQYSKPGAGIEYSYDMPKNITAGETVTFQLTLDETYNTGDLNVGLTSDGGLQMFATNTQSRFNMGGVTSHIIDVSFTAPSNGRHYINVQAMADSGNGQVMPRIFSIPVQVGPEQAMKPHQNMTKTSSGENIIVMEAQEVIQ